VTTPVTACRCWLPPTGQAHLSNPSAVDATRHHWLNQVTAREMSTAPVASITISRAFVRSHMSKSESDVMMTTSGSVLSAGGGRSVLRSRELGLRARWRDHPNSLPGPGSDGSQASGTGARPGTSRSVEIRVCRSATSLASRVDLAGDSGRATMGSPMPPPIL